MKFAIACLLICSSQLLLAQQRKPVDVYMGLEFISTHKDATEPNNPWGIGTFITLYGNTGKLRPVLDIAGDVFLMDDKVGRTGPSDEFWPRVHAVLSVMGGIAVSPDEWLNAGFLTGPAFVNGNALWAIKPYVDMLPGKNGKVVLRLNYLQTSKR